MNNNLCLRTGQIDHNLDILLIIMYFSNDEIPSPDYDWANKGFINQGAYGQVFKVIKKSSRQQVAIKRMAKSNFPNKQTLKLLMQEVNIQRELKHQNIMTLFEVFDNPSYCFIVMQLCDCSLRDHLQRNSYKIPIQNAEEIFRQLMKGVKFMVDRQYIHRDVKPQNVLLKGANYKVSDFGFATKADISGKKKMTLCCGTPLYMSPQILEQRPYTSKCDIWSWGMLLFQVIFGRTPWPCRDEATYLRNIKTQPLRFPYQAKLSFQLKDILEKSLTYDEEKRIGWSEFFEHPFFRGTKNHIQKPQLSPSVIQSLRKLSNGILKNGINIEQVFQQFKKKKGKSQLDREAFTFFVRKIDPSITSIETNALFTCFDKDKQGSIDLNEMVQLLKNFDFQNTDSKASRTLLEIKQIVKNNNIDVMKLFKKIDIDKSGQINKAEFFRFIKAIAPGLREYDSNDLFNMIDSNGSGTVDINQFFQKFATNTKPIQTASITSVGKIILKGLKATVQNFGIDIKTIMGVFDIDRNGLSLDQFTKLIRMIEPFTDTRQIESLFCFINNGSREGTISSDQFLNALNKI